MTASSSAASVGSTQLIACPSPSGSACTTDSTLISCRRATHLGQHGFLAARLERALQHQVFDEVRDDAVLALGGDDHQPFGAGLGRLGGDQLDAGRVDDGQQLLGHRLGRGQETRTQTGRGHDRRAWDRDFWA